jgi:TP901 family phage tail tape measure protein
VDDEVALAFAAEVTEAVASVRDLAAQAQALADTAKEASAGVASITEPATAAGDAVKGVADASTAADGAMTASAGAAREAAAGYGELATAAKDAGTAQEGAAAKSDTASAAAAGGGLGKYKMALVGIGVGAAVAVDSAVKFQGETTRLVTSAGESASNLDKVRQGMLSLSSQTGTSTAEMASGMYTVESAGYHGAQGLVVLKAAAQGAKDEGANLATVSNAVTDALVDYHLPASSAANVTSQLITAVSHGKTTFQDFSGSMSNILPLASSLHLSLADVSGVLAEMTAHGMSADQASQDEANAMRELMKPNAAMVKEMTALGITSQQVYQSLGSRGLAGTMQWLSGVAKDGASAIGQNYTQALGKLMGTAPGLVTALMTTGENAKATDAAIRGIGSASADAQGNVIGFSEVSQTAAFKLSAAKESAAAAGTALGEALLPSVMAVLGPLTRFLQLVASNHDASIAFAVVIGGLLAGALGLKLAGALKDAAEGIKLVGEGGEWLIGKLTAMTAAQEAQTVATEAATAAQTELDVAEDANPIGLIILAIIALIAIIVLVVTHLHFFANAFDIVRHAVATAGHDIASAFDVVRHAAATIGDDVIRPFQVAAAWISGHWKEVLAWLVDPIGMAVFEIRTHTKEIAQAFDQLRHDVAAILDGARHDVSAAFDAVRHDTAAIVDAIPGDIRKQWDQVRHDAAALGDDVLHALESAGSNLVHTTSTNISSVLSFFEKLPGQVASFLAKLPGDMLAIGKNVITGLINGIKDAAAAIPSLMSSLASDVASYFTNPLKLFSPSRLFFDHGWNIVQGAINGVRANTPALLATMRGLGAGAGAQGLGSAYAAGAVAPAAAGPVVHVTVPVTATGTASGVFTDPRYQQDLQAAVQEVTLRHAQLNPTNGLTPVWGHG